METKYHVRNIWKKFSYYEKGLEVFSDEEGVDKSIAGSLIGKSFGRKSLGVIQPVIDNEDSVV